MKDETRLMVGLMGLMGLMMPAMGQLTATVTPGYQFSPSERPTTATLNQLGQPTIAISGTISGTVGLTAGSVTGVHLADSVVDGITLMFNSSTPRAITVKPYSIGTNVVSTNLAGFAITGGNGLPLSLTNFPSSLLTNLGPGLAGGANTGPLYVTNVDLSQLSSTALGAITNIITNSFSLFTTALSNVVPGLVFQTNHPFARAPQIVRFVMVNQVADINYAPGDEVDVESFYFGGNQAFAFGASATAIFCTCVNNNCTAPDKNSGSSTPITPARWKLKGYASFAGP